MSNVRNPKRFKRVKERVYGRWEEEVTTPQLRGKIGFEDSLRMLINICMTCPPEERPQNINMLYWSLPQSWHDKELNKAVEECIEEFEESTPVINCGVPVKPEVIPWTKEIVKETNWKPLFNAILNCCQRHNLLIPLERVEIVTERE